ncbi:MAG: phage terminase small subunit P27 family [Planctomycetes bacterium]|nr:phage terminase small subunit P27 family [Planctomycetota bacterium]
MARPGRRPKPTAVKKATGNPGRRPLNENEPQPEDGVRSPYGLRPRAKSAWRRLAPQLKKMGCLKRIDAEALARYCTLLARYWEAEKFIEKHGTSYPIRGEDGKVKYLQQVPQVGMANKLAPLLARLEQEFGMTPSARAAISLPPGESDEESLEAFVARKPRLMTAG